MRFAVACTLALLLAPPLVSSTGAEPRDALAVSVYTADEVGAIVTWTVAPGAIGYAVYRGDSPESATFLAHTPGNAFHDPDTPDRETWYVILSVHPQNGGRDLLDPRDDFGGFRGSCISQRGATGVTVTASHCLPSDPF
jgi:hypothetical protein